MIPLSLKTDTPDKLLFTPGPLTTSRTVKEAMLRDLGSRDAEFITTVKDIRRSLLALAGATDVGHAAVLMQGSGTFGIESVLSTTLAPGARLLAVVNGAYGRRIMHIASVLNIDVVPLVFPENRTPDLDEIESALAADRSITDVAVVHCETTSGIVNPVPAIGRLARRHRRVFIVDAMSSFGALPLDVRECRIDYLVSSANKCIEGVPGFSFVIARKDCLDAADGYARSVSLDLRAQWREMETTGQFRFTPPTHALLAFHQALRELEAEGGVPARHARYRRNQEILAAGMRALGFREYLRPEDQSPIITSFHYPSHPRFAFGEFYARLNEKGFVIYPGKVSDADCFRIGTIGRIDAQDVRALLDAVRETLDDMQVGL